MPYKEKYLKYKNKYFNLKNQFGGNDEAIINSVKKAIEASDLITLKILLKENKSFKN